LLGSSRSTGPAPSSKPAVNTGLRILIAGAPQADEAAGGATEAPAVKDEATLPCGIRLGRLTRMLAVMGLTSADLALLGWATEHVVAHKHALSLWAAVGCTCSLLVAAMCGAAAVSLIALSDRGKPRD
jgi:hypothetical protein